jgi:hypothetical protein
MWSIDFNLMYVERKAYVLGSSDREHSILADRLNVLVGGQDIENGGVKISGKSVQEL